MAIVSLAGDLFRRAVALSACALSLFLVSVVYGGDPPRSPAHTSRAEVSRPDGATAAPEYIERHMRRLHQLMEVLKDPDLMEAREHADLFRIRFEVVAEARDVGAASFAPLFLQLAEVEQQRDRREGALRTTPDSRLVLESLHSAAEVADVDDERLFKYLEDYRNSPFLAAGAVWLLARKADQATVDRIERLIEDISDREYVDIHNAARRARHVLAWSKRVLKKEDDRDKLRSLAIMVGYGIRNPGGHWAQPHLLRLSERFPKEAAEAVMARHEFDVPPPSIWLQRERLKTGEHIAERWLGEKAQAEFRKLKDAELRELDALQKKLDLEHRRKREEYLEQQRRLREEAERERKRKEAMERKKEPQRPVEAWQRGVTIQESPAPDRPLGTVDDQGRIWIINPFSGRWEWGTRTTDGQGNVWARNPLSGEWEWMPDKSGRIRVHGDAIDFGTLVSLIGHFCRQHGDATIQFNPLDSNMVPKRLANGEFHVGITLDCLAPTMDRHCDESFRRYRLGQYAVAVVVNRQNPMTRIDIESLDWVFTGRKTTWEAVGGRKHLGRIELYSTLVGSKGGVTFRQTVLGGFPFDADLAKFQLSPDWEGGPVRDDQIITRQRRSADEVMGVVAKNTNAIAFFLYDPTIARHIAPEVRVLGISATPETAPVLPTESTIADGSYPITSSVTMVVHPEASPLAHELCEFMAGPAAVSTLQGIGLWPEYELEKVRAAQRVGDAKAGKGQPVAVCDLAGVGEALKAATIEFARAKLPVQVTLDGAGEAGGGAAGAGDGNGRGGGRAGKPGGGRGGARAESIQ